MESPDEWLQEHQLTTADRYVIRMAELEGHDLDRLRWAVTAWKKEWRDSYELEDREILESFERLFRRGVLCETDEAHRQAILRRFDPLRVLISPWTIPKIGEVTFTMHGATLMRPPAGEPHGPYFHIFAEPLAWSTSGFAADPQWFVYTAFCTTEEAAKDELSCFRGEGMIVLTPCPLPIGPWASDWYWIHDSGYAVSALLPPYEPEFEASPVRAD